MELHEWICFLALALALQLSIAHLVDHDPPEERVRVRSLQ